MCHLRDITRQAMTPGAANGYRQLAKVLFFVRQCSALPCANAEAQHKVSFFVHACAMQRDPGERSPDAREPDAVRSPGHERKGALFCAVRSAAGSADGEQPFAAHKKALCDGYEPARASAFNAPRRQRSRGGQGRGP